MAERRWASVLFADLVGFTTLSESRDPEQVRELLSRYFARCRSVVAEYDGVVEKFIGDAVMAVWGVPAAHEDDAERAVRAGMDLATMVDELGRELGAPLALRVGVVTGEVAVNLGATSEGMIAGDPVNTAARVQTAAEPGQVWVDGATRSLTAHTVDFTDTGEHALKGKALPVRLFAVARLRAPGTFETGVEAPLVGRDRELGLMRDLFEAAVAEARPRLIVVDGEAGVGKSRLVREFESWVDARPQTTMWHRGRCLSYGEGVAFRALSEAVRTRLGLLDGDSAAVAGDRLAAFLADLTGYDEDQVWVQSPVALLIGADDEGSFEPGQLFAAWTRFFELVGAGNPVVLVVDDAHHADDGLLDFIDHLMSATRTPIVVIAMARPDLLERRPGWGGRRAAVVPLAPLSDEAMDDLLSALLDGAPRTTRDALAATAGGLPLFAVETVRSLVDQDLAVLANGRATLTAAAFEPQALAAPASLRSLIRARLDALPADQVRVVGDASVLGLTCTLDGLIDLAPEGLDVAGAVAGLRQREILDVDADRFSGERGQLRFTHALVRQVAYDTLSRRDRKARHLAAARHIAAQPDEAEATEAIVAQHLVDALEAAFDDDPDRSDIASDAVTLLEGAADRAWGLGAPGQAWRLQERASSLTSDPHERARFLIDAAEAATTAGSPREAQAMAARARVSLEELGDIRPAADAVIAEARALLRCYQPQSALDLLSLWLPKIEAMPDTEELQFDFLGSIGSAYFDLGMADEEQRVAERQAEKHWMLSSNPRIRFLSLQSQYTVCAQAGDRDGAIRALEEAIAVGRRWPSRRINNAAPLVNLAAQLAESDLDRSRTTLEEAVTEARRSGSLDWEQWAEAGVIESLYAQGRFEELAARRRNIDMADLEQSAVELTLCIDCWAQLAIQGRATRPGFAAPAQVQNSHFLQNLCLAAVARGEGRGHDAASAATNALAHIPTSGGAATLWSFLPLLADCAVAGRDHTLCESLLMLMGRSDPADDTPMRSAYRPWCRAILNGVAGTEPTEIETDLRTAPDLLDSFGAAGYAGLARSDLGCWLLDHGDRHEAEEILEVAERQLNTIGAHGWQRQLARRRASPDPWRTR